MANTDITLKNGDISAYGLACGYVQTASGGPIIPDALRRRLDNAQNYRNGQPPSTATIPRYEVRLTFNGCTYDVERWDHENLCRETTIWEQFDTLTEARRAFRRMVRESA